MPPDKAGQLDAPPWLNSDFIRPIVEQHLSLADLRVVDLRFYPASAKGDHCLSLMFRAVVQHESVRGRGTLSLIIKTLPEEQCLQKKLLDESHIFRTEIEMYTKVLPHFELILWQAGDPIRFGANCLYNSLKPRPVMVFEDLSPQGYAVIRRVANVAELQAALTKLAKWHAVSFKLLQEQPGIFDHLRYDITTLPNFLEQQFISQALDNFLDMLNHTQSLQLYRSHFEAIYRKGNLISSWVSIAREYRENSQEKAYYVLLHGDFHLRNLMFRGDDCLLLDFQMSHVGSMVNDMIYAKYVLFDATIRREKSDQLIRDYFRTFLNTLRKIGYPNRLPSLAEYRRQMFERRAYDLLLIVAFMPLIQHFRNGGEEIVADAQRLKQLYYQREYLRDLEELLPQMLQLGYFASL